MYCTLTHDGFVSYKHCLRKDFTCFSQWRKETENVWESSWTASSASGSQQLNGPSLVLTGEFRCWIQPAGCLHKEYVKLSVCPSPFYRHCSSFSVHLQDLKRVCYKIIFFLSRWTVSLLFPKSKIFVQIFVSCLVKSMCLFLVGANKIKMAQWVPRLRSSLKPCSIRSDTVWLATLIHLTKMTITSQILQAVLSTEVIFRHPCATYFFILQLTTLLNGELQTIQAPVHFPTTGCNPLLPRSTSNLFI